MLGKGAGEFSAVPLGAAEAGILGLEAPRAHHQPSCTVTGNDQKSILIVCSRPHATTPLCDPMADPDRANHL